MPPRLRPPRLWLRPARRDSSGRVTHPATYFIRDRGLQVSAGSADASEAEEALAAYLVGKHKKEARAGARELDQVPVADVLEVYASDVAPHHARPEDAGHRIGRLLDFFADKTLAEINGPLCRQYANQSSTDAMARRDLEELRAAVNHHRREGLHDRIVSVVLPARRPPRERWLDRDEAARLLRAAWRRPKCGHVAKFILVALYTGRRSSVVCSASFKREPGKPWVDLKAGMLWPPEQRHKRRTKKQNPPIPLPDKLLAHLRRGRAARATSCSGATTT